MLREFNKRLRHIEKKFEEQSVRLDVPAKGKDSDHHPKESLDKRKVTDHGVTLNEEPKARLEKIGLVSHYY